MEFHSCLRHKTAQKFFEKKLYLDVTLEKERKQKKFDTAKGYLELINCRERAQ